MPVAVVIHRHTGGLEKNANFEARAVAIHRHTGGLDVIYKQLCDKLQILSLY